MEQINKAKNESHTKVYIMMVFAAFFWSGAFIAGKYSVPYIPPVTMTFFRFFFATIILFIVMKVKKIEYKLKKEDVPVFLFTGIIGMIGYHVLFFSSLKYTTAINSSIIGAANPIATSIIAGVMLKNRIPKRQIIGIIVSFIGVVLTLSGGDLKVLTTFDFNKGDLLMLCAMLCWAVYGVFSKAKGKRFHPIVLTLYSFIFCVVFIIPLVLIEQPWNTMHYVPFAAMGGILYMAIFPSVIGYLTQQYAIKEIGPTRASVFVNLVPFFSMILAVTILKESLEPIKILTALLIIFGVYLCQSTKNK